MCTTTKDQVSPEAICEVRIADDGMCILFNTYAAYMYGGGMAGMNKSMHFVRFASFRSTSASVSMIVLFRLSTWATSTYFRRNSITIVNTLFFIYRWVVLSLLLLLLFWFPLLRHSALPWTMNKNQFWWIYLQHLQRIRSVILDLFVQYRRGPNRTWGKSNQCIEGMVVVVKEKEWENTHASLRWPNSRPRSHAL